jgi:hypothetical protein
VRPWTGTRKPLFHESEFDPIKEFPLERNDRERQLIVERSFTDEEVDRTIARHAQAEQATRLSIHAG